MTASCALRISSFSRTSLNIIAFKASVGRVAVDSPHAAFTRQFFIVGKFPEVFPEILLEFAGGLPLRVDFGFLALLVDDDGNRHVVAVTIELG